MMRKLVAFYPFIGSENEYICKIREIIRKEYILIDYLDVKCGLYDVAEIRTVYMNWIEGKLDDGDKKLLIRLRLQGCRIVWVFHNRIPHDTMNEKKDKENIIFLCKWSSNIIIHSSRSVQYLVDYTNNETAKKVKYVPHPNYIGDYGYLEKDIRKKYCISENEIVVASYGLIRPYKNQELLLSLMKEFEHEKCKLLIKGELLYRYSEFNVRLKRLCSDSANVILDIGHIPNACMGAYLKAADVIVLPYDLKSSMNSGVMMMAFSYGKPVIVPDIAMAEEFDDKLFYKYFYTNEKDHYQQLTAAIRKAISNGREQNRLMGDNLRRDVEKRFSYEVVERTLLELL